MIFSEGSCFIGHICVVHSLHCTHSLTATESGTSNTEALFRAHARFVAAFLSRLGVNSRDLDDLVQEVFLIVHRNGGYTQGPARPTTWLAEIAIRVVSNCRRTERRHPTIQSSTALATAVATSVDPFQAVANTEALERVQNCLNLMDLEHRVVFILFELEGEDCESIALGLRIPVGTVYSRLYKARRIFRKNYGNHGTSVSPSVRIWSQEGTESA